MILSWAPVPGATNYYPRVREVGKASCDAMGWNWNPANSHCTSNNYTGTEVMFPVNPGVRYNAWVHAGDPYNPTPVHAQTFMCPAAGTTSPQHSLSFSVPASGQIYRVGERVTVSWTHQNLATDQAVIQLQGTQG